MVIAPTAASLPALRPLVSRSSREKAKENRSPRPLVKESDRTREWNSHPTGTSNATTSVANTSYRTLGSREQIQETHLLPVKQEPVEMTTMSDRHARESRDIDAEIHRLTQLDRSPYHRRDF